MNLKVAAGRLIIFPSFPLRLAAVSSNRCTLVLYVLCCIEQSEFPFSLSEDSGRGQGNGAICLANLNQSQRNINTPALAAQEPDGSRGQTSGGLNRNSLNRLQGTENTTALVVPYCNGFLGILVY